MCNFRFSVPPLTKLFGRMAAFLIGWRLSLR